MRVIKTKEGSLYIETMRQPETVTDHLNGNAKYYYIHLPTIPEIIHLLPTPLLEDIQFEAQTELQIRDRRTIPDAI